MVRQALDYRIEPVDERRMAEIEAWLDAEQAAYDAWEAGDCEGASPGRGFRCNWDAVKNYWRAGDSEVFVLLVQDEAVGFLDGNDILEIRPDMRRHGFGRVLAEFMLERGYEQGRSVIEIDIAPRSAQKFWQEGMGFTVLPERRGSAGGLYAYKVLPRAFGLGCGTRIPFSVSFYTEEQRYQSPPHPFRRFVGDGEELTDGSVQLPERAYCFYPESHQHGDYFVEVDLSGRTLISDKAKRPACSLLGVARDVGGIFYVDRITPQD